MLGGTVHRVLSGGPADAGVFGDRGFTDARRGCWSPSWAAPTIGWPWTWPTGWVGNAGPEVTVLHVVPPGRDDPGGTTGRCWGRGRRWIGLSASRHTAGRCGCGWWKDAGPAEAVVRESAGFDLVLVGLSDQWGLESHLFEFRTERIAQGWPRRC